MYIMIICHWAILHYNMSFKTIAGRSDGVFWWFPALSEDQEKNCRIHQNYLVALSGWFNHDRAIFKFKFNKTTSKVHSSLQFDIVATPSTDGLGQVPINFCHGHLHLTQPWISSLFCHLWLHRELKTFPQLWFLSKKESVRCRIKSDLLYQLKDCNITQPVFNLQSTRKCNSSIKPMDGEGERKDKIII